MIPAQYLFARKIAGAALATVVALLTACTTTPPPSEPIPPPAKKGITFTSSDYADLPAVDGHRWEAALTAFRQSCSRIRIDAVWSGLCSTALSLPNSAPAAESFFRSNFTPWGVETPAKKGRTSTGLMTGYYEPLLYGSRVRQPPYVHPIYGIPDNLLTIDLGEIYPDLKGRRLRGKLDGRRVVPYDKRGAIQEKEAEMARWAIAWVSDPVDAFFLHVQGSGRIVLPDGSFMRVGFADQNGWRYHSIGQWLITHEHLSAHELSMQRIRSWAKANPSKVKAALAQNPSYIFFEERKSDTELGPIGAAGVPLTPEASVAVDQKFWKLGTPFIVSISQERPALAFTQPVIAQDTGGAIQGALRFDYFWGFGDDAGAAAGRQKSAVAAWLLVPNGLAPEEVLPNGAHAPR